MTKVKSMPQIDTENIKNIDKDGVTLVDSNNPGREIFVPQKAFFDVYFIQGVEFD